MSHTPGPWIARESSLSRDDWFIDHAYEDRTARVAETWMAENAHLIAAAPDLLAALKEYIQWFGAVHGAECPADDTCDCIGGALNARVSRAIAKAEGR